MMDFEILITSPNDKEKLTAELWYKTDLIAEINQESTDLEIELYINKRTILNFDDFLSALEIAKQKLSKNNNF